MDSNSRGWPKLIRYVRGMDRIDVAQFMAEAIDEMVGDNVPPDEIADACASICRKLGVDAADLRRALN
jgi:4-aminobutyrate aminotransferase-like enzyme